MTRIMRYVGVALLVSPGLIWATCPGVSTCLPDGTQASGAKYRICMPDKACWNGQLVLFAHGYVDPSQPIQIPEDQLKLPDGTSLPVLVNNLGYAFATTSYSTNGLAVLQGIQDLRDLVHIFRDNVGHPSRTYLTGASEGGLITTLSLERYPDVYNAGLAACGPIGDFPSQINYIGDFRVIFDYLFPGVLPGNGLTIPQYVIDNWQSVYSPAVSAATAANPGATQQLLKITLAPGSTPSEINQTVQGVLGYNIFATNDARQKLGGNPFDNRFRIYLGSSNDLDLNLKVPRTGPDPAAVISMQQYQTSGKLTRPLVTLHTTGDQIVPYWHESVYWLKAAGTGSLPRLTSLPVFRYGHCNFQLSDVLLAFDLMVLQDLGHPMSSSVVHVLPPAQQQEFVNRAGQYDALLH